MISILASLFLEHTVDSDNTATKFTDKDFEMIQEHVECRLVGSAELCRLQMLGMDFKSLVTVRQSANERLSDYSALACVYVLWGLIARPANYSLSAG